MLWVFGAGVFGVSVLKRTMDEQRTAAVEQERQGRWAKLYATACPDSKFVGAPAAQLLCQLQIAPPPGEQAIDACISVTFPLDTALWVVAVMFFVPLSVLGIGASLGWAIRGFRPG